MVSTRAEGWRCLQVLHERSRAPGLDGPVDTIGPQFFNELRKREAGREALARAGCSHFLLMDCDECYLHDELQVHTCFGRCLCFRSAPPRQRAKELVLRNGYDATACRMRLFFKEPQYEFFPYDNYQAVPFICRCGGGKIAQTALTLFSLLPASRCRSSWPPPMRASWWTRRVAWSRCGAVGGACAYCSPSCGQLGNFFFFGAGEEDTGWRNAVC